jgi:translation initiation factor 3 subunit C
MSRFFRGGDDSSSESSSDEEELYGSDEEQKVPTKDMDSDDSDEKDSDEESESESSSDDDDAPKKGLSRFLVDQDTSESEESGDEAGTAKVKSAKDKRHDELEATITGILNGQKINDWVSISNGACLPPFPPPARGLD